MQYLPTIISLTRIPLALIFLKTSIEIRLTAIFFAALSDFFDGWIARRFGLVSRIGATIDPLTDKLFVFFVSIILLMEKDLHPLFFSLFFLRDAFLIVHLITYRKFLKSATVNSNFYGKLMTLLQFMILTATIFGINHMQYITLLFPYLSVRYWLSIRQNIIELPLKLS